MRTRTKANEKSVETVLQLHNARLHSGLRSGDTVRDLRFWCLVFGGR